MVSCSRPGPGALYTDTRELSLDVGVQIVPGVSAPNAREAIRTVTSSTVNASPGWAADCSIRTPRVEPDLTAVAETMTPTRWFAGGMVNDAAVSLMMVPVVPTRSRRMIRPGLPTADAEAAETVAYAMNVCPATVERMVGWAPPWESE